MSLLIIAILFTVSRITSPTKPLTKVTTPNHHSQSQMEIIQNVRVNRFNRM